MGCDIHLYVEYREHKGTWAVLDPQKEGWSGRSDRWDDDEHMREIVRYRWWSDRDYTMFSMLAGVRDDGSRLANALAEQGVDIKGYDPLAPRRGLPDDVNPEIQKKSDGWGVDGHSHTYFTLDEWYGFDLNQTVRYFVQVEDEVDEDKIMSFMEPRKGRIKLARHYADDPLTMLPDWLEFRGKWIPEAEKEGAESLIVTDAYVLAVPDSWWAFVNFLYVWARRNERDATEVRIVCWFDN